MALAWVLTLPAAALVAGLVWKLAEAVGSGATGSVVMAVLAAAAAVGLFFVTRGQGAVRAADVA
jgi:inorganic phosphate transporter, PiT family